MEEVEKRIVHSSELTKLQKEEEGGGGGGKDLAIGFDDNLVMSKSNLVSTRPLDLINIEHQQKHKIGYFLELESRFIESKVHSLSGLNKLSNEQPIEKREGEGEVEVEAVHIRSIRELINQYDTRVNSYSTVDQCKFTAANSIKQCQVVSQGNCKNNDTYRRNDDHVLVSGMSRSNAHHDHDRDACISCKSCPFVADIGVVPETSTLENHHHNHGLSPCMSSRTGGNGVVRRKPGLPKTLSLHSNPPSKNTNYDLLQVPLFWDFMHKEVIHSSLRRNFSIQNTTPPSNCIKWGIQEMYPFNSSARSRIYNQDIKDEDKDGDRDKVKQPSPDVQVKVTSYKHNDVALISKKVPTKAKCGSNSTLSPLSFGGYVEKADEFTPVPQEYIGMDWRLKTNPLMGHSPKITSTSDYEARMKTPKTSLKSAFRELESVFNMRPRGSASAPKSRPNQALPSTKVPEKTSSRLVQRLFASPVKRRPHDSNNVEANMEAEVIQRSDLKHLVETDARDRESIRPLKTCDNAHYQSDTSRCMAQVLPGSVNNAVLVPSLDMDLSCKSFLQGSRSVHSASMPTHGSNNTLLNNDEYFSTTRRFKGYSKTMRGPNHKYPAIQCYLQCITKDREDGLPLYTLSRNDSEEVLLARACDFKENVQLSERVCKGMYTFHAGKCIGKGWRSWMKKENKAAADLVGKMQVMTTMHSESSLGKVNFHSMVSEFVLFGIRTRAESYIAAPTRSQSLRLVSNNANIHMRANPHDHATCASHLSDSDISDLEDTFPSSLHQELAAIVIEMPVGRQHKSRPNTRVNRPLFDGMSVESNKTRQGASYRQDDAGSNPCGHRPYLDGASVGSNVSRHGIDCKSRQGKTVESDTIRKGIDYRNASSGPDAGARRLYLGGASVESNAVRYGIGHRTMPGTEHKESVTVMLPREQVHHGLPGGRVCRPTSLIDRWRCGGKCDCGGWDLGCGMKVLSSEKPHKPMFSPSQRLPFQPLNIYSQGKVQELVLSLTSVQEGFFLLNFQGYLSPLEAFATSVAVIHSRRSSSSCIPSSPSPSPSSASSSSHISPSYISSSSPSYVSSSPPSLPSSSSTSSSSRRS